MAFHPQVGDSLSIDGAIYQVAEHPAAPGIPYGQEGRQAIVYQLVTQEGDRRALKVFKARYRLPALVSLADQLAPFAGLPGLQVCQRIVLSPRRHEGVLRQQPDLTYAVLMPWIEGPTWMEVMLGKRELTPEQSLALARSLAHILVALEERGIAHCDLSGPNVLLPALTSSLRLDVQSTASNVQLVDVEQLHGPGLERPALLPGGSPGYAHRSAPDGLWGPAADRFSGAVLLGEMLGWCDARVREATWGENYFHPAEIQQESDRYCVLVEVLQERWGERVARSFERAWRSETLADCPALGEWLIAQETWNSPRKEVETMEHKDATERLARAGMDKADALMSMGQADQALRELEDAYNLAPELVADTYTRALVQQAAQREDGGDVEGALTSYRCALQVAPEGGTLRQEIAAIVQRLEVAVHGPIQGEPQVMGKPAARPECPTSRVVLWLVIMLAGWAGTLGSIRFLGGNEWVAFVSWAMVGILAGLAQYLVVRGVAPVRPWWVLGALIGWCGCWALGGLAASAIQVLWFVEAGHGVDTALRFNLWWSSAWQIAILVNAVFNGAAAALLLRGRSANS